MSAPLRRTTCAVLAAAVLAIGSLATFGPVHPARASAVAQRGAPRTGPRNQHTSRSTALAVALIAAIGLAFWLINEDLARLRSEALAATEGTES